MSQGDWVTTGSVAIAIGPVLAAFVWAAAWMIRGERER